MLFSDQGSGQEGSERIVRVRAVLQSKRIACVPAAPTQPEWACPGGVGTTLLEPRGIDGVGSHPRSQYPGVVPFHFWDISDWPVISQEARGLDPKDWVAPPAEVQLEGQAHWWLFKPAKTLSYRRYDDWSEKVSAELASLLGLPSARIELARKGELEGIISGNVTPNGWYLESGDALLSDLPDYVSCAADVRPKNRIGHNLDNIAQVLRDVLGPPGTECGDWSGMEVFAGYTVLDAWIANTDRHALNWGVLTQERDAGQALAASFDHGSALGSGLKEGWFEGHACNDFALRGRATRFEHGCKLTLVEFAHAAVARTGGRATRWIERLRGVDRTAWEDATGSIEGMSDARRRFMNTLLDTNQRRLLS